jgi:hypothetical protein
MALTVVPMLPLSTIDSIVQSVTGITMKPRSSQYETATIAETDLFGTTADHFLIPIGPTLLAPSNVFEGLN